MEHRATEAGLRAGESLRRVPRREEHYDPGLTGLALLAFLRGGHEPDKAREIGDKTVGRIEASQVVRAGLKWLQARQGRAGFSKQRYHVYYDAIATMAFAEAARLDPEGPWRATLERAVDQLVAARRDFFEAAALKIMNDLPRAGSARLANDYYYWYQASVALNGSDGARREQRKHAGAWNKALIEASTALQDRTQGACTHGAWLAGDRWSYAGGAIYSTAINVLALEECTGG